MKALTIQQPWASLITMGVKTIETRSWSTKYRGALAIHAGLKKADIFENELIWQPLLDPDRVGRLRTTLHLGAVVATCELVDVVPIFTVHGIFAAYGASNRPRVEAEGDEAAYSKSGDGDWQDISDQVPYGDFSPERFAWILSDIKPIEPIPVKGHQGLWNWEEGK